MIQNYKAEDIGMKTIKEINEKSLLSYTIRKSLIVLNVLFQRKILIYLSLCLSIFSVYSWISSRLLNVFIYVQFISHFTCSHLVNIFYFYFKSSP